jgi:hypothetical protein
MADVRAGDRFFADAPGADDGPRRVVYRPYGSDVSYTVDGCWSLQVPWDGTVAMEGPTDQSTGNVPSGGDGPPST